MKLAKKKEAIALRHQGYSIGSIARTLSVSKSSVSSWVSDVALSKKQLEQLRLNSHARVAVENRRIARLHNEQVKRMVITDAAIEHIKKVNAAELFFLGLALYWGEGTKKKRGVVEFTNSDSKAIQVMMRFFRESCAVPQEKFRGHVYVHEHISTRTAELYWSQVASIPLQQFHKTSIQHNKKKLAKDTLPHGTFAVSVCDTKLKLQIMGWIEGVYRVVNQ